MITRDSLLHTVNRDNDMGDKQNSPTDPPENEETADESHYSGRDDSAVTPAALRSAGTLVAAVPGSDIMTGPDLEFSATVRHYVSAAVSWDWPCGEDSEDTQSYILQYYNTGGDPSTPASNVRSYTTLVLLQDLQPDAVYVYRVRAVYTDGTQSDWSSEGHLDTGRHMPRQTTEK